MILALLALLTVVKQIDYIFHHFTILQVIAFEVSEKLDGGVQRQSAISPTKLKT